MGNKADLKTVKLPKLFIRSMSCEKLNQAFSEKIMYLCFLLHWSLENCFQRQFEKSFNTFVSNAHNQIKVG